MSNFVGDIRDADVAVLLLRSGFHEVQITTLAVKDYYVCRHLSVTARVMESFITVVAHMTWRI